MKLIKQQNRNFLGVLLITMPLVGIALFLAFSNFMEDEIDENLHVDEFRIINQLKDKPQLVSIVPILEITELDQPVESISTIRNVYVYDPLEKEDELFRELQSIQLINGKTYSITIRHSILERKDFLFIIGLAVISILVVLALLLFLLNRRFSIKLWKPFNQNLAVLSTYSVTESKKITLADSEIDEFQTLKSSLIVLTEKLAQEYKTLKEFTENASHEIQTPLAIISMNLEEVLQDEHSQPNYKKLYASYQSVQRLSKLNQRLLLLAKLDNNQFNELTAINFNTLIGDKLEEFMPLFEERKLNIKLIENGIFIHSMDPLLANMTIENLLSNVAKHGLVGSNLEIELNADFFTFSNHTEASIQENSLFERFTKGNGVSNSTGLGLSIVKKIVEVSNLTIQAFIQNRIFEIKILKK